MADLHVSRCEDPHLPAIQAAFDAVDWGEGEEWFEYYYCGYIGAEGWLGIVHCLITAGVIEWVELDDG